MDARAMTFAVAAIAVAASCGPKVVDPVPHPTYAACTVEELATHGKQFHGKRVEVSGVAAFRFEHHRLYSSWEGLQRFDLDGSTYLRVTEELRDEARSFHGAHVTIEGTFDAELMRDGGIVVDSIVRYQSRQK
jgi:hypothetical protein